MTRRSLAVLVALAVGLPASAADPLPPDLALVPGNALGFVHVKLADVWKADTFKDARGLFEKAGPKAIAALDDQFVPAPSTVSRGTLVVLPPADKESGPVVAVILGFSKPFDAAAVRKANLPKAAEKKAGGKAYFADDTSGYAVHFADDRTLVVGDPKGLQAFLTAAGKSDGPMKAAVEQAAKEQVMATAADPSRLPFVGGLTEGLPALAKAERLTLTMNFTTDVGVALSATYPTADDAKAAEKWVRDAAAQGRKGLEAMKAEAEKSVFGADGKGKQVRPLGELPTAAGGVATLAWVNWIDENLADPPLKATDRTLTAKVTVPAWAGQYIGVATATLLPAVQKVREAAARMSSSNNLRQIAIAMHNHEAVNGTFPAAAVTVGKGKKLLSWRVAILPYIEQDNLYRQFKLDEPWDSEHNKTLIPLMPKTYADPRFEGKPGETYYKVFVGKNCGFDWQKGKRIPADFPDGTSNTVMVAAGGDPVIWSKPDDFEFDPTDATAKLPDLSKPFGTLLVALFDGSVRAVNPQMKDFEKKLRAAVTPAGGEVLGLDDE